MVLRREAHPWPVSPRPWRKIIEAVCLIRGLRITGFRDRAKDIFFTNVTKSLRQRDWSLGLWALRVCPAHVETSGRIHKFWCTFWWSLFAPPCIACASKIAHYLLSLINPLLPVSKDQSPNRERLGNRGQLCAWLIQWHFMSSCFIWNRMICVKIFYSFPDIHHQDWAGQHSQTWGAWRGSCVWSSRCWIRCRGSLLGCILKQENGDAT